MFLDREICITLDLNPAGLFVFFSFASALMNCGEHKEANICAETVLTSDPFNVKV
jgi:hypothetical protein